MNVDVLKSTINFKCIARIVKHENTHINFVNFIL